MPPRSRCTNLVIRDHAHNRWRLRAPGMAEPGPGQIMGRLNNMLRLGVVPDSELGIWVPVAERLSAVCIPQTGAAGGGWAVATYRYHGQWARYEKEAAR